MAHSHAKGGGADSGDTTEWRSVKAVMGVLTRILKPETVFLRVAVRLTDRHSGHYANSGDSH
jgi:hypothetical protein